jgi:hypothetical protein
MLLSTEFLFALFVSFIGTGARCRLGFSRRFDAASYQTASLRAKVGTQSSEHGVIATSEHEQSSGGFRVEGHVRLLCGPDAMEKNSELACHRDYRSVLGLLASSFSQMKPPSPEGRVLSLRSQDMVRALDQETSQINVACFSNAELRIAIARLAASWSQAEIAAHISTSLEALLVFPRVRTNVRAVMWPTPWIFSSACVSGYSVCVSSRICRRCCDGFFMGTVSPI